MNRRDLFRSLIGGVAATAVAKVAPPWQLSDKAREAIVADLAEQHAERSEHLRRMIDLQCNPMIVVDQSKMMEQFTISHDVHRRVTRQVDGSWLDERWCSECRKHGVSPCPEALR